MVTINTKPLLPLRDIVVFPSMVVPLFVGREKSIKALQEVMKTDKSIVLVSQKNSEIDEPENKDIYGYGCLSKVLQLLKLPDGTVKVLVEGEKRVKILEIRKEESNFLSASVEVTEDTNKTKESDLYALSLVKKFEKLLILNKRDLSDSINSIKKLKDPSQIADNIASNLNIQIFEKQELLEIIDLRKRLEKINELLDKEISVISVEKKIRGRVKNQMEKTQREYYLNEQLKAIQKELGEIDEGKDEIAGLNKSILKAKMPKLVQEKCMAELKKLKSM
ncbi:MAG: LON peptidase substrate-binding domain-containing protein, partial [Pelagibacteraceae bacterium]